MSSQSAGRRERGREALKAGGAAVTGCSATPPRARACLSARVCVCVCVALRHTVTLPPAERLARHKLFARRSSRPGPERDVGVKRFAAERRSRLRWGGAGEGGWGLGGGVLGVSPRRADGRRGGKFKSRYLGGGAIRALMTPQPQHLSGAARKLLLLRLLLFYLLFIAGCDLQGGGGLNHRSAIEVSGTAARLL